MSKKTIVVFSGDYDKLIAAFTIATGAAAMDDEVAMFFTFWGLAALRKPGGKAAPTTKKQFLQKMFAFMLPHHADRASLSNFNFGGAGRGFMKKVMKDNNIMSVPELMASAREQGVRLQACTMSMEVLGITKEELIDDIEYVGVASYLAEADEANVNLFI